MIKRFIAMGCALLVPGTFGFTCSGGICLPADYNKMDLPGEKPIHIDTQMFLNDIYEVNQRDLTIHIRLFMLFSWRDNRLNFTTTKETSSVDVDKHFIDSIWTPDFFVFDMKELEGVNAVTTMRGLNVQKDGDSVKLLYSMVANVKFMCAMSFKAFPFDSNQCKFRVASYKFPADQIVFNAVTKKRPDMELVKEKVREYEVTVEYLEGNDTFSLDGGLSFSNSSVYSVVGLKITFSNLYWKFIWVNYLPTSMFTVTSWVSFLLPPTSYPSRTSLLVTLFLCQIGIFNAVIKDTPNEDGGTKIILLHHILSGHIMNYVCLLLIHFPPETRLEIISELIMPGLEVMGLSKPQL